MPLQGIMATNRADTLDPALLRPGRLDRKIEFPLPDRRQKRLIFSTITGKMNLSEEVDLEDCIGDTGGDTGGRGHHRGGRQATQRQPEGVGDSREVAGWGPYRDMGDPRGVTGLGIPVTPGRWQFGDPIGTWGTPGACQFWGTSGTPGRWQVGDLVGTWGTPGR